MSRSRRRSSMLPLTAALLAALLLLNACSDAADPADTPTEAGVADPDATEGEVLPVEPDGGIGGPTEDGPTEDGLTEQGEAPEPDVVVVGVDYAYEDLPAEIAAGSTIGLVNDSDVEAHELVVFRLPDDETRPVEEVWPTFEPTGPPTLVSVAAPGEPGSVFVGDGTVTEPGRYIAICFLPIGGDPVEILQGDGPPESDDPPHATEGMVAEFTVV